MEIAEITAFVAAIGALVAATAGLIREVRKWSAAKKNASTNND